MSQFNGLNYIGEGLALCSNETLNKNKAIVTTCCWILYNRIRCSAFNGILMGYIMATILVSFKLLTQKPVQICSLKGDANMMATHK